MNKLKATLDIFANNKALRLGALTLITASLAVPAFAAPGNCTHGVAPEYPICTTGIPYASCNCDWSATIGYYNCVVVQQCVGGS
jgi:hypothetical protein